MNKVLEEYADIIEDVKYRRRHQFSETSWWSIIEAMAAEIERLEKHMADGFGIRCTCGATLKSDGNAFPPCPNCITQRSDSKKWRERMMQNPTRCKHCGEEIKRYGWRPGWFHTSPQSPISGDDCCSLNAEPE